MSYSDLFQPPVERNRQMCVCVCVFMSLCSAQRQHGITSQSRELCDRKRIRIMYGYRRNTCRTLYEKDNAMKVYVVQSRDVGQNHIYKRKERRECVQEQNMVYRK